MNQYVEVKVDMQIEGASDTVTLFSGFADMQGAEFNERADSVKFDVYTVDDIASRLPAEVISTQCLHHDVDGNGTTGLVLPGIGGIYITGADIQDYVINPGVHTLTHEFNNSIHRVKFDTGAWVTVVSGSYVLGDGEQSALDRQRCRIYVDTLESSPSTYSRSDEFVVVQAGEPLPNQWYINIQAETLIRKLYDRMGISNITFDAMEMNTYDDKKRILFLDMPPNNPAVAAGNTALATDGTDLFIAVGNVIYKKIVQTGEYIYIAKNPSAGEIHRVIYNARNNHLWVLYANSKVRKLDLSSHTFSSEVELAPGIYDEIWKYGLELIDYNYSGSNYIYGLVYARAYTSFPAAYGTIRYLDGLTLTDVDLGQTAGVVTNHCVVVKANSVWFKLDAGDGTYRLGEFIVDSNGDWIENGVVNSSLPLYDRAIYNPFNDRIYFYNIPDNYVASHPIYDNALIYHKTDMVFCDGFALDSNGLLYFTDQTLTSGILYSVYSQQEAKQVGVGAYSEAFQLVCINTRLYGLDNPQGGVQGTLYQCDDRLVFFVPQAVMKGMTVKEALSKVLNAFLLIGTISSMKKAFVYRRGDSTGIPQTTGHTLMVTAGDVTELTEINKHIPKTDLVRVSNGTKSVSFDGTRFNADVLSDKHVVEINNDFIPESLLNDIAYYAFQFLSIERNLYKISLGCMPLVQFEPFDKCSVTFTGKLQKIASGPIYATEIMPDGTVQLEVLL